MDPYGLPRFDGENSLPGWTDHSDIATRTLRIFTCGQMTAFLRSHPGVWDVIVSDGRGSVTFRTLPPGEIAETLRLIAGPE
jgi:hypothetical protein